MSIAQQYESKLTTQQYGDKQTIEGVQVIPLQLHTDDGGNFLELFRLENGEVQGLDMPFPVKQMSMSLMEPGVTKAYHVHKNQEDLWFVPPHHRLLVNLHDLRQDSPTFDNHMRLVLGGGKAHLLRIPKNIAHGIKNCYSTAMLMFYATTEQFESENPDEHRLPWDAFGSEVWDLIKG